MTKLTEEMYAIFDRDEFSFKKLKEEYSEEELAQIKASFKDVWQTWKKVNLSVYLKLPQDKFVIVTEKELFNKLTKRAPRTQKISNAERLKSYTELAVGDYVVHVNHGVGVYQGMETLEINGVHQDYMSIHYQDGGHLFVPVHQIKLVQKYVSSDAKVPKLNKLGSSEWAKTKRKVETKIEDIADFGPLPSAAQLAYHRDELAAFIHFGINTFYEQEWGNGQEDPKRFNPTKLDTDQWIRVLKETGFKRVIVVVKHHDGFVLYPSHYTDYTVAASPWRDGKSDLLAEISRSFFT